MPLTKNNNVTPGSKQQYRDNAAFITSNNDSAKSKSHLLQIPSVSLPKSGGAIKSIDEKFSVNTSTGTASFSFPLPMSAGRNGKSPVLNLAYNSGNGNSIFGVGWNIDYPYIQRKTDKKLPEYKDGAESDTFIFSGAEDLVPALKKDGGGNWVPDTIINGNVIIKRYRPRIESNFSRIEKIETPSNTWWRIRSSNNDVSVYGESEESKLRSPVPGDNHKIFRWCLEYTYDDKGSFTRYSYKKENFDNIIQTLPEKNRLNGVAPCTNIYLKKVQYCNTQAWYEGDPHPELFHFSCILDYGEHDTEKPTTEELQKWTLRKDPFSDYKSGLDIRTYRICNRLLMFHHFKQEFGWDDYLVHTLDFVYDQQPHLTYLEELVQTGYIWNPDGTLRSKKSMPPLSFTYSKPGFNKEVIDIDSENLFQAPEGVDGRLYQFTDLYSEGIPGILSEQNNAWYYKENLGNGNFTPAKLVSQKPSFNGLQENSVALQELEANGKKYLVVHENPMHGYFELLQNNSDSYKPFESYPNINLNDPDLKYIDLDGDGLPDLLISNEQEFIWYRSLGKTGYDDPEIAAKAANEEKGPLILFSDNNEKVLVAIADMTGDGLGDILIVSNASVVYYPNLGYGRFGARVEMVIKENPLEADEKLKNCFDTENNFNPDFIHLADIDGSGTTDIVYLGNNKVEIRFNEAGNSLSKPDSFFNPFPLIDNFSKISFIDLLGAGTTCMVWSSSLPANRNFPLRYIDLMGGKKPHMLQEFKNNLGKEVSFEYKPSTYYYLNDKKSGVPWTSKLSFPVQCVSQVITEDKVARSRFTTSYLYRHGYYDSNEREFRGFAYAEQRDSESYETFIKETLATGALNSIEQDIFQPPVITKTWYHVGASMHPSTIYHQLQDEYYPKSLKDPAIHGSITAHLPESAFLEPLTPQEYQEASRALKGFPLRKELYSDEGDGNIKKHPYTITHFNYSVNKLQPKQSQKHGVFFPREEEALTVHYERNPDVPRITHSMNLEIDSFGNVIRSASVVYGRKTPDPQLTNQIDQDKQKKQQVLYTVNRFTEIIDNENALRLPALCEAQTFELNTTSPATAYFTCQEIDERFENAVEVLYEQHAGLNQKRKIEHSRNIFLKNDLSGPMPLGFMDTLALEYEAYILAFTPTLIEHIYGGKFHESLWRNKAGYRRSEGDNNYWVPSGKKYVYPDLAADPTLTVLPPPAASDIIFAKNNFYLPVAFQDNSGSLVKVFYDPYKIFVRLIMDPVGNTGAVKRFNYRAMQPQLITDANENRTAARFDEFGFVSKTFTMGKEEESRGDYFDLNSLEASPDDQPSITTQYQFRYFESGGKLANRTVINVSEEHYYVEKKINSGGIFSWLSELFSSGGNQPETNIDSPRQMRYEYSDGSGHILMKKIQAEPGMAPQRDPDGNVVKDSWGKIIFTDTAPGLRWVGDGRTIFNNKGNPVKQYEPFFDSSPEYNTEEELTELGSTGIMYYDALGRTIKKENPDGSFAKFEFTPWIQYVYDENDTIRDSKWYQDRINGAMGDHEKQCAMQSSIHHQTPRIVHLDSLGRPFLTISHNKFQRSNESIQEELYYDRTDLDIEGNTRSVSDNRSNILMSWKYDMLGNICYQESMDSGRRWILLDTLGKNLRLWDNRMQVFNYEYDPANRPLAMSVIINGSEYLFEKYEYGEIIADARLKNLRGRVVKQYDIAGILINELFDFKGNLLLSGRQLVKDYKSIPDWKSVPVMEDEIFETNASYDALNRTKEITSPDKTVYLPVYNEANLLNSLEVKIKGENQSTSIITNINYNAKGQRDEIFYGNNTKVKYTYDPKTYRLTRLLSTAINGSKVLQDLNYTYDPSGNITRCFDNAQKTIFYGGQQVEAESCYIYDALYRLIEASGREHMGQLNSLQASDNFNDDWCNLKLQPNSPVQMRNYTQKFSFDSSGNILKMQHIAGSQSSWTRLYKYNNANNQLVQTSVGSQAYNYQYNEHGSMIAMPHIPTIEWNHREEMHHADLGGGAHAWYNYDSGGQRIRKVIEKPGNITEERIYIGAFEIYRERTGNSIDLERESYHVIDNSERVAIIDTRTRGNDGSPKQTIRYQYVNVTGSASLELDADAEIISYEEYHPFGTTAYSACDASRKLTKKRFRYTGMERDEETGLNYHSSRYYTPWLGRWISADPVGIEGGTNLYEYAKGRVISGNDPTGNIIWFLAAAVVVAVVATPQYANAPTSATAPTYTKDTKELAEDMVVNAALIYGGGRLLVAAPAAVTRAGTWAMANPAQSTAIASFGVGLVDPHPPGASPMDIPGPFDDAGRVTKKVVGEIADKAAPYVEKKVAPTVIKQIEKAAPQVAPKAENVVQKAAPKVASKAAAPAAKKVAESKILTDKQLVDRSKELFEKTAGEFLKTKGKDVAKTGPLKAELTVAVLQTEKNGKTVTLIAVNNPKYYDLVKKSLKPGEELIEPIVVNRVSNKTGEVLKDAVFVHAEQVVVAEAAKRGYTTGKVATSNLGCKDLCQSVINDTYKGFTHVNPK